MTSIKQTNIGENVAVVRDVIAVVCAVWFLLTGWMWGYLMNLMFAYPVGLVALVLWYRGRKATPVSLVNRITLVCLILGLVVSLVALLMFK